MKAIQLTIRLDGGTEEQLAEYGGKLLDSMAEAKRTGSIINWDIKPDQLLVAELVDVDAEGLRL